MRGLGSVIAVLFVVGLIVKFIWWILGGIAVVALFYVLRSLLEWADAREEAYLQHCDGLASRADQQHRWVLEGDERGIYGEYPVPDIVKRACTKPQCDRLFGATISDGRTRTCSCSSLPR